MRGKVNFNHFELSHPITRDIHVPVWPVFKLTALRGLDAAGGWLLWLSPGRQRWWRHKEGSFCSLPLTLSSLVTPLSSWIGDSSEQDNIGWIWNNTEYLLTCRFLQSPIKEIFSAFCSMSSDFIRFGRTVIFLKAVLTTAFNKVKHLWEGTVIQCTLDIPFLYWLISL